MYLYPFHPEQLSQFSFLITGGAGFIGSHLVEYLMHYQAGKVIVLDNLSTGSIENIQSLMDQPNFELINGDIRDVELCQSACQGIDYVLHQAALGSVPRSVKDPLTSNEVNVNGFLNMLVAARDQKVKRFVYAASSSVYGDSRKLPKVENETGKPLSPYAVTKVINELYADVFAKVYEMEIIGLRYFNVFGPRQSPEGPYAAVIPRFIQALLHNQSPGIFGDGEQTRDFTFVENAVQANIKALFVQNPEALNQVYNIALGEKISLNQLFHLIQKKTNSRLSPQYLSERAGDIRDSLADISKARHWLDYQPAVRIEQGLELTLEWFKSKS